MESDSLPRYAWVSAIPITMLVATAFYLHQHWDRIPTRFPVHWSAGGQPNGWSERTIRGVYGPILFGIMFVAWLIILNLVLWYGVRGTAYRNQNFKTLLAAQCVLGFIPSVISIMPVVHLAPGLVAVMVIVPIVGIIGFSISAAMKAAAQPTPTSAPGEPCVDGFWYFNRSDPALAVPRRDGLGYVPNFARASIWLILIAPILIFFISAHWIF